MFHTLTEIQSLLQARWLQCVHPEAPIVNLLLDSRGGSESNGGGLFFALPGKRHDGHDFIAELYGAGVRHFVVSRMLETAPFPEADFLLVPDSRAALQAVAAWHRGHFSQLPIIGITGSNGKTIVKEWLFQLLRSDFEVVRSPKSYNSQTGVPLSVWQIGPQHTLGIFEAGISEPGEMARLAEVIRPKIGIFTNIGPAHREGFVSKQVKIEEKMRLFDSAEVLIYCADHPNIAEAAEKWLKNSPNTAENQPRQLFAWSKTGQKAALQMLDLQPENEGTRLTALFSGEKTSIIVPFSDAAALENACHCWAVALCLGLSKAKIAARMRRLEPVEMRLQLKAGINGCTLIDDAYNTDLVSLRIALQFATAQGRGRRLTLLLSDILQSGQMSAILYEKVAQALLEQQFTRVLGIGKEVEALRSHLPAGFRADFFGSTDDFLQNLQSQDFRDEVVLLKGARPFAFERIVRRLEQKAHKTVLEVNLSALVHNLNVYARLLRPGTRIMAMVKAAAYGSGAAAVAKLLEFHKVNYLGVAYADEGIELRQAGVQLPILVLNPEAGSFDALLRFRLEPEIYSPKTASELLDFAGKTKNLSIHLKLDTGMHRLGFAESELPALLERLRTYPNLRVQSVFSHLAASDAPVHDDFTEQQGQAFARMSAQIAAVLGYAPLRHLVNTGGIARFPQYHFDMVRLGIGLYGVDSSGLQAQLQVVNTLKASISQIKVVPPGDSVGYNRNGRIERPTKTATISIGYADGLLRLAGNGRFSVQIHGKLAPTVGSVCMDMTMVDVTHIPEAREGDEVLIFGETLPVQTLAAALQTIPYEVFTGVSGRVKRVYWQE